MKEWLQKCWYRNADIENSVDTQISNAKSYNSASI